MTNRRPSQAGADPTSKSADEPFERAIGCLDFGRHRTEAPPRPCRSSATTNRPRSAAPTSSSGRPCGPSSYDHMRPADRKRLSHPSYELSCLDQALSRRRSIRHKAGMSVPSYDVRHLSFFPASPIPSSRLPPPNLLSPTANCPVSGWASHTILPSGSVTGTGWLAGCNRTGERCSRAGTCPRQQGRPGAPRAQEEDAARRKDRIVVISTFSNVCVAGRIIRRRHLSL